MVRPAFAYIRTSAGIGWCFRGAAELPGGQPLLCTEGAVHGIETAKAGKGCGLRKGTSGICQQFLGTRDPKRLNIGNCAASKLLFKAAGYGAVVQSNGFGGLIQG